MYLKVLLDEQLMWNIPLFVGLLGAAVCYSMFIHRFTKIKWYQKQPLLFFISLIVLYVSIGSPLSTISHLSFSLHMIQMSILFFIVPPLLLMGIPTILFQRIKKIRRGGKWFLSPRNSLFVFAILLFMYHLPIGLHVLSQNAFLHNGIIIVLLMLSLNMWMPLVSPEPKQQFNKEDKKRFAFLSGVLLLPACLLFLFSAFVGLVDNPFLTELTATLCIPSQSLSLHILPPPFNTGYDQAIAGFIMLGIHKTSLVVTTRIEGNYSRSAQENPKKTMGS